MGALADRLRDEPDPAVRQQIKLDAYNERADQLVGRTVARGHFTLTLTDLEVVLAANGKPVLQVVVSVVNTNTGKDVTPPDLNPIWIVDPVIAVPDPTGEIEYEDGSRARESLADALLDTLRELLRSRVG